jgi:hypothetical protein
MSPDQARLRILRSLGTRHVEPFQWMGVTYGARVPSRVQFESAFGRLGNMGHFPPTAWLAVQCVEVDGARVFKDDDYKRLLEDEPAGFVAAFWRAVSPFLIEAPPVRREVVRG